MPNVNKVILIGNLTREPVKKALPSGDSVCDFGIAINRTWKDKDSGEDRKDTCFIDCTAFSRRADVLCEYCGKGDPLFIEGHLKLDAWEDKEGNKRSKLRVVIDGFQFLKGRSEEVVGGYKKPAMSNDVTPF